MMQHNGYGQLIVGGPTSRMLGVHYSLHVFGPDDERGTIQLVFAVGELGPGLLCRLVTADGSTIQIEIMDSHGDFLFFRARRKTNPDTFAPRDTAAASNSRHKPVE